MEMPRKVNWKLTLDEVETLIGCLYECEPDIEENNPWADGIRALILRSGREFPELPYVLDSSFLKEELEREFRSWADSLPDNREESIELTQPPQTTDEYMA